MKRLLSCWLVIFYLLGPARFVRAETGLVQISEHIYSYVDVQDDSPARSFGANAGIIIGENGILVVDTLVSAREGARLLADIRKISDKPVRYVVNTHYHLDHTFGNKVFAELGAEIISHVNCAAAMRQSAVATLAGARDFGLTAEDMVGTAPAYPNLTFSDRLEIYLGGISAELLYFAPSHSKGSIVVNVPAEKVMFAGDILFTDFHPYLAEGDMPGWQKSLDDGIALRAAKIIPGHGPLSTNNDMEAMKAYLAAFDSKATELATASDDIKHISAELLKAMPSRSRGTGLIQANIQGRYLPVLDK